MPSIRLGKVSISPRGEFTLGTAYDRLDLVYSPEQRSSYLCIQTNAGEPLDNPACWMLVAHGSGAYEAAVKGGYTGTEEAFNQELSQFSIYSEQAQTAAAEATTQANHAQASADTAKIEADRAKETADKVDGVLNFNPDDFVSSSTTINGKKLVGNVVLSMSELTDPGHTTVVLPDGRIEVHYQDGRTATTSFQGNEIQEVTKDSGGTVLSTKTTTFHSDGSIEEAYS